MKGCCPPNAEKYLAPDYKFNGSCHTLSDGVEYYATGDPSTTKKAVLLIPDIFGWNGGRTRNIADWLAENGYYTVIPKLMVPAVDGGTDGDGFVELGDFQAFFAILRERFSYPQLAPRLHSMTQHLKQVGIEKICLLGFCWGGWTGCHLLSSPEHGHYACMAIGHPSVHLEEWAFGKSAKALFDTTQAPLLLLPCKGDPDAYRVNGDCYESIKARYPSSKTIDFADHEHGFIPRCDITKPGNHEAVDKALHEILSFFNEH